MLREELSNIKSTPKELRKFGLTVGIAFVVLAGLLLWLHRSTYPYFAGLGVMLTGLGLFAPGVLKPIQKPWMMVSVIIGWLMTRVLMGLLFILFFTPVGFITRLFGRQHLDLKINKAQDSYWKYRESTGFDAGSCERQF